MLTTSRLALVAALALSSIGVTADQSQRPLGSIVELPLSGSSSDDGAAGGSRPLIDTKALQDLIKPDALMKRAEKLYAIAKMSEDQFNHPTRVIGSHGHMATLEYIVKTLQEYGTYYNLSTQNFPVVSGSVFESRLVIGSDVPESARTMALTPPTHKKQPVYGDLVLVNNNGCQASDYPKEVDGNIAFISRGTCSFGAKSEAAGKAGAVAAVIYNSERGELSGTLGTPLPDHVATFGLSREDAQKYIDKLKHGKAVDAIAYIDAELKTIKTTNIVAQTVEGDPDNCVMLGGHSDSVTEGPGINDDGSGSISVLEVAVQLTKFKVNNCVRLAWWAAEEEGLLGSDHYANNLSEEENKKIRLFMDYDMMASPNFALQIYNATNDVNPAGSQELRDLYVDWYTEQGLNYTFVPFDGRSDYDGFIRNGIPAGGIATGAEGVKTKHEAKMFGGKAGDWFDPCYHQLCDDLSNVNLTIWETNTKLIAHSVATYALSFDGFPKRTESTAQVDAYAQKTNYHGPKLVM